MCNVNFTVMDESYLCAKVHRALHLQSARDLSRDKGSVVLLNVLGRRLAYQGQAETNAEAWFNKSLRPRKPEGSLGRTAQDGHLDSHTAPEL